MDYREAGVDIAAGRAFVEGIRQAIATTHRPEVLGELGGFGGYFRLPSGYSEPVLVAGTDGVGTKLKLAFALNRHHSVGIDLVAMCVNDILTCGAEPLFFLDYLATGKLAPEQLAQVVEGIAAGCRQSGCALIGGETAEMPGFYRESEYDLAGFCVGIVDRSRLIDGSRLEIGDVAIALASSGLHSNGFSLVRRIVDRHSIDWHFRPAWGDGSSLGDIALTPTQIYVKPILAALEAGIEIRGMAHITGGGLPENLPRCLPAGLSIRIDAGSWTIPPIFSWLAQLGEVSPAAMYETFNMGVGYVVLVPPQAVESASSWFNQQGLTATVIGEAIAGNRSLIGLPPGEP